MLIVFLCANRVLEVAGNTLVAQEKRYRYVTVEIGKMMKVIDAHSAKPVLSGSGIGSNTPSSYQLNNVSTSSTLIQIPDQSRLLSSDMRSLSVDEEDNNNGATSPIATIAGQYDIVSVTMQLTL